MSEPITKTVSCPKCGNSIPPECVYVDRPFGSKDWSMLILSTSSNPSAVRYVRYDTLDAWVDVKARDANHARAEEAERERDAAIAEVERLRKTIHDFDCDSDRLLGELAKSERALADMQARLDAAKRQGDEDFATMLRQRNEAVADANAAVRRNVELQSMADRMDGEAHTR